MKYLLPLSLLLVVLGCQSHPIANTLTHIIQGGQSAANLMMVTSARAIAPFVDGFVGITSRFMLMGKHYIAHLDSMLTRMDLDPQMQMMAEAMHQNLYDMESSIDALMTNAEWGGSVIKSTAECVVPQYESITKIKDEAFRALGEILQEQKAALTKLGDAGYSIQDQVDGLQVMEAKVAQMVSEGKGLEAMDYIISNRQKTEKEGRDMEKVYFGALDEYREATSESIKKLADVLGKVYESGDKIMTKLDSCLEPKIRKLLKTEIANKKSNRNQNKHIIPETLTFQQHHSEADRVWQQFHQYMPEILAPTASAHAKPSGAPSGQAKQSAPAAHTTETSPQPPTSASPTVSDADKKKTAKP